MGAPNITKPVNNQAQTGSNQAQSFSFANALKTLNFMQAFDGDIKPNVDASTLSPRLLPALNVAQGSFKALAPKVARRITSTADRPAGFKDPSFHLPPFNTGVDLQGNQLSNVTGLAIQDDMRKKLGDEWFVKWHDKHIHVNPNTGQDRRDFFEQEGRYPKSAAPKSAPDAVPGSQSFQNLMNTFNINQKFKQQQKQQQSKPQSFQNLMNSRTQKKTP